MATGDYLDAIKEALNNLSLALQDISTLTVTTAAYDIDKQDSDVNKSRKVAETVIKLDGDTDIAIPVKQTATNLAIQADLYNEHKLAVEQAKQARAQLLSGALQVLTELKNLLD